ncbi:uncharacterized protein EI90DRAFT_3091050 [Cantharellus anzutake]|uniref:uncharacterized protein n=1 Tax=Cantharellus anzutake TaxID=1750568 RepID=UPI00190573BE|nr:uncharacterized protein EI90DRAFT_3091050 [Cantharellus anzutake]KAF8313951.1 hypothetical protein EI90DRAFT_3091050 [Cantharellus anzutake]
MCIRLSLELRCRLSYHFDNPPTRPCLADVVVAKYTLMPFLHPPINGSCMLPMPVSPTTVYFEIHQRDACSHHRLNRTVQQTEHISCNHPGVCMF